MLMEPYLSDPDFTLWNGDAREVLRELEDESIDCCATSPPFFGLRDYGVANQIGLEATPDLWVAELVQVFREVRRVLRPAGTLWVECGDSYANDAKWGGASGNKNYTSAAGGISREKRPLPGVKQKDLIGAPWMLAFALRADGWYLRQCIIWQKPNAMPESARDRCTTAHSYLFLFSKQPRYWFDADAIAEPAAWERWGDQTTPKYEGTQTASGWMRPRTREELAAISRPQTRRAWELVEQYGLTEAHLDAIRACGVSDVGKALVTTNGAGHNTAEVQALADEAKAVLGGYYREFLMAATRTGSKNARSVWSIPTQGYPDAHFATWPEALVERVLKAGCPEWVCGTCGKAWERVIERGESDYARLRREHGHDWHDMDAAAFDRGVILKEGEGGQTRKPNGTVPSLRAAERTDYGFAPACSCRTVDVPGVRHDNVVAPAGRAVSVLQSHLGAVPGVALDPFMGSGTTALVARRLGRRSIGIELNPDYCAMSARRLQQQSLFA